MPWHSELAGADQNKCNSMDRYWRAYKNTIHTNLLLWVGIHFALSVWHESNVDEATVVEHTLVSAALRSLKGKSEGSVGISTNHTFFFSCGSTLGMR